MSIRRRSVGALLGALMLAVTAAGQAPPPPPVPAAIPAAFAPPVASPVPAVFSPLTPASNIVAPLSAAPAPVGIAPYPPPPGPPTLGQFLGLSYPQREYRQRRMARTPLGKVREKIQTPLSKLTGGLIPPFPPKTPALAELQAPGAIGAAAKGKLDRETAIDRIEAVEYLGTLDCHYWPEAEDALVGTLRADRNEWVRLAAAQVLGKGCCCTKKTITALSMVVNCSMEDGNPVEKSPKVIAAAQAALCRCLAMACACEPLCAVDAVPVDGNGGELKQQLEEKPREGPDAGMMQAAYSKPGPAGYEKSAGGLPANQVARLNGAAFYERVTRMPWGNVIATGRTALMNTPRVPAEVLLAGASRDLEMSGVDLTSRASTESPRPSNLFDMLMDDDRPEIKPATLAVTVNAAMPHLVPPAPASHASLPARASTAATPKIMPAAVRTVPPTGAKMAGPHAIVPASVTKPESVTPRAAKVTTMLAAKNDPRQAEPEIDALTSADFTNNHSLARVLMSTAEENKDPWLRAACIRALGRGKVSTPGVTAGLERLLNDRMTTVRVDAAVALNAIRGTK